MLEIRHMRTLVALRETGSLVEAADRVYLTQSALSHQVKELEGRLGTELFVRKSRPLRFSEAGKRLLRLSQEVLERIELAERDERVLELWLGGMSIYRIAKVVGMDRSNVYRTIRLAARMRGIEGAPSMSPAEIKKALREQLSGEPA